MNMSQGRDSNPGSSSSKPSVTQDLNDDCLQQLFARCSPADVLQVLQTCRSNFRLLNESVIVWASLLEKEFGLTVKSPNPLIKFARSVYAAKSDTTIRFQAVYTNGGVDEDAMQYWVDNMFRADKAPYCSNVSNNADSIALLLDGEVPRDAEYEARRRYIMRRCRYAAALMENLNNPAENLLQDANQMMHIVEEWSEQRLEHFFKDLVIALHNDNALGRLLVFDIPHSRLQEERERIDAVYHYLEQRPRRLLAAMLKPPGQPNTLFDTTVMDKIKDPKKHRTVGVIKEVVLCRAGSLTCPALTGIVYVGKIDYSQLETKEPAEILEELTNAAAAPVCVVGNSLSKRDQVEEAISRGELPPIVSCSSDTEEPAGQWVEFQHDDPHWTTKAAGSNGGGANIRAAPISSKAAGKKAPLVRWQPLLWYRFKTKEEAALEAAQRALQGMGGDGDQQQDNVVAPNTNLLPVVPGDDGLQQPGGAPLAAGNAQQQNNDMVDEQPIIFHSSDDSGDDHDSEMIEGQPADWSDEELEDLQQGQPMVVAPHAPAEALDDGDLSDDELDRSAGRNLLHVRLSKPCSGNVMLVKLIDQENLMREFHDLHNFPNIDMAYVQLIGKLVHLPDDVTLAL